MPSSTAPTISGRSDAPAPLVTLDKMGKCFGDGTEALAGFDLSVMDGEFVALVGPSGCGKTTLLRAVAGLTRIDGGSLTVGTDKIGYVFQDPALLPWRTARGNVELFSELEGVPRTERRRRAAEAIALVGLDEFTRHRPHQLSGGMRMRVSLARSLTTRPQLFLLDEPFGALDELTRQRMNEELLRLFLTQAFTALFVTHSVSEAVFLSSRVVVISSRPGRVLAEFPVPFAYPRPSEIRFSPAFAEITGRVSACLQENHAASASLDPTNAPATQPGQPW
ncbi:ABC transporter ATP-binding protein [Streptomyces sp. NPDC002285]